MPGEDEETIEETEEEENEEEEEGEEDGLEYATDTPSGGSYTTPPSTGGCSSPLLAPSRSPTLGNSNPENHVALHTEELEARIEAFLEEAEEDLEMDNLPPLENTSLLLVPAPVFPGFVPFAVSTGQHCVLPGSYPTVNEQTPVEIPFFGRCEGICLLISGWFQIHVNKPTQPIPGWRIETSAQTWQGGLFVYSCLEPAVHRAHPLLTLDIKGSFTGLPYGVAGKEPGIPPKSLL